ncbi:hypothetical protein [Cryobacterium sp. M25]|uniref:hypothetical protein n=1 Tax=Cryobacterium sp. M25 TaxID=2048293 RepID=UPI000CE419D2|nr:hypothetical protein [Cryobacterium sp. M25]
MKSAALPVAAVIRHDLGLARHEAAHVLACLAVGGSLVSARSSADGLCTLVGLDAGADPTAPGRISMAGPCLEIVIETIEGEGDAGETMVQMLESWRDDAAHGDGAYLDDMVAANGFVAEVAAWALAFCTVNSDLIDEAALMIIHAGGPVEFATFAARFNGRIADVEPEALDAAECLLVGSLWALERIDEAVAEYLSDQAVR